jgi:hypothetical protein
MKDITLFILYRPWETIFLIVWTTGTIALIIEGVKYIKDEWKKSGRGKK